MIVVQSNTTFYIWENHHHHLVFIRINECTNQLNGLNSNIEFSESNCYNSMYNSADAMIMIMMIDMTIVGLQSRHLITPRPPVIIILK